MKYNIAGAALSAVFFGGIARAQTPGPWNIESIGQPELILITFACFAIFLGIVFWGMRDSEKPFPWRGVAVAAAAIFLFWATINNGSVIPQMHRDPVTPPSFPVGALQMQYYRLNLDGSGGRVYGRFEASGGFGNDIEVVVASADQFENWQNGHPAVLAYRSGKTTVANLDVRLSGPGVYYVGFDNRFSLFSGKTILANIVLQH